MAVNVNCLYCACIVHGIHVCLKARVDFVYIYLLISILFLNKDITVNVEHRNAESIIGWQDLEHLQSQCPSPQ